MTQELEIRPLLKTDLPLLLQFTDRAIGSNYYSMEELVSIFDRSQLNGHTCSLVLSDKNKQIFGVRITYPHGQWSKGKGQGLSPQKWKVDIDQTAYFQSLFIDPELTHHGWGKKMSLKAIELLKSLGSRAIVTHSWKESPHDSSGKYLRSLGFELVATHEKYWFDVDYFCTRCGKPCVCTAEEMICYL